MQQRIQKPTHSYSTHSWLETRHCKWVSLFFFFSTSRPINFPTTTFHTQYNDSLTQVKNTSIHSSVNHYTYIWVWLYLIIYLFIIIGEAERIRCCKGRVFAADEEPDVYRLWMPDEDCPGLAMARAFGDFCLKDYGLISIPDVSYRRLTSSDEFVVLATDGVSHKILKGWYKISIWSWLLINKINTIFFFLLSKYSKLRCQKNLFDTPSMQKQFTTVINEKSYGLCHLKR